MRVGWLIGEYKIPYGADFLALARSMHAESRYADGDFDYNRAIQLIYSETTEVIGLFDDDDVLIGGALLYVTTPFWTPSVKILADYGVYIAPEHRTYKHFTFLVQQIERTANVLGCNRIELGVTAPVDPERTVTLYRRHGYAPSGTLCVKELTNNVLLGTAAPA